jgi:hypothetical protein
MPLRTADFESAASTSSTTPARKTVVFQYAKKIGGTQESEVLPTRLFPEKVNRLFRKGK